MDFKGFDVSQHNGIIEWNKLSDYTFCILRAGYGNSISQKDTQFDYNIDNALKYNFKIFIYWFGYALSENDAIQEASICDTIIKKYKSHILAVFYDYEYDSVKYYKKQKHILPVDTKADSQLIKSDINKFNISFCNKMKSLGYKTGIYYNNDYRRNILTDSTITTCGYRWLADYSGSPDATCDIQQTSSTGHINGIHTNVDTNTCFININNSNDMSFTSDTTQDFELYKNDSYQFKITAKQKPSFAIGTPSIFNYNLIANSGNNYIYRITAIGNIGESSGIYVNNKKICVVSIKSDMVISDTPNLINVEYGHTYQFKLTSNVKPKFVCGNSEVFNVDYVNNINRDYFFKVTATGNVGQQAGFYINSEKTPRTIGTII